jgi:hypothetical protein
VVVSAIKKSSTILFPYAVGPLNAKPLLPAQALIKPLRPFSALMEVTQPPKPLALTLIKTTPWMSQFSPVQ